MSRAFVRAVAFAALVAAGVAAAQTSSPGVRIVAPYARATPPGAQVGAGYLTIVNDGTTPDRLVSASSPDAQSLALHEMTGEGGVMRMRAAMQGVEIKPGETLTLKPGGYHLMFEKPRAPFSEGGTVRATLTFEHAGPIAIELPVGSLGASAPPPH